MDQEGFSRYLSDRYEKEIAWYDSKASLNRLIYTCMQWVLIVLAALTPVLIEIDPESVLGQRIAGLATVTSIVVAILTAGLKTFKYQENWLNYRTTCETLRKEQHLYDFGLGDYENAESREAMFVGRVESLISRENTAWVSTHQKQTKATNEGSSG